MGACDFRKRRKGTSAKEVFEGLVSEAKHEDGHGGYTGTIAEKTSFVVVEPPVGMTPETLLRLAEDESEAVNPEHQRIVDKARGIWSDKWGPALCVKTGENEWTFAGLASS